MKINKKIRNILIGIVIVGLIGGIYAFTEYNRKPADLSGAKADISISAPQLLAEYSKDENAANKKYLNKVTTVSGVLKSIDKDHTGSISLALETGDPLSGVSCELDSRHITDASGLHVGDNVLVTGLCTGMLTDVVLVRCSAQKK